MGGWDLLTLVQRGERPGALRSSGWGNSPALPGVGAPRKGHERAEGNGPPGGLPGQVCPPPGWARAVTPGRSPLPTGSWRRRQDQEYSTKM